MVSKDLTYYLSRTKQTGDCLEWTKSLNTDGYPRVVINGSVNGKGHREVFFLVNGYYPPVVRHTCDNIKCINPDHLVPGTPEQNAQDRHDRKRTANFVGDEEIQRVKELRLEGLTHKLISEVLGVKIKRVAYIMTDKVER